MGVIWNREGFKNISYVRATSQVEEYIMGRSLDSRSLLQKIWKENEKISFWREHSFTTYTGKTAGRGLLSAF